MAIEHLGALILIKGSFLDLDFQSLSD